MGSDDEDNCISVPSDALEHGKIAAQVNTVFDEADDHKRTLKCCVEAPKKWKYIIRIDEAACNTFWQDAVKRKHLL